MTIQLKFEAANDNEKFAVKRLRQAVEDPFHHEEGDLRDYLTRVLEETTSFKELSKRILSCECEGIENTYAYAQVAIAAGPKPLELARRRMFNKCGRHVCRYGTDDGCFHIFGKGFGIGVPNGYGDGFHRFAFFDSSEVNHALLPNPDTMLFVQEENEVRAEGELLEPGIYQVYAADGDVFICKTK